MSKNASSTPKSTIYFTDGYVIDKDTAVFPAGFLEAPDIAASRVAEMFRDGWAHHDVPNDIIISVTFLASTKTCFLLGKNGVIEWASSGSLPFEFDNIRGFSQTHLPAVPSRGNMTRIRAIGDSVYACGWGNQVYILKNNRWAEFEKGLGGKIEYDFEDIDGTAPDDIYAVGIGGVLCHCDGKRWSNIDSPTNSHFSSVHCVSSDEVYIAGNDGNLFQGNYKRWRFIGDPDKDENYWGLQMYNDELYATYANSGLRKYDGKSLHDVDMGVRPKPTTNRLHAGGGILISIGAYDLVAYDGSRWWPISCPENE